MLQRFRWLGVVLVVLAAAGAAWVWVRRSLRPPAGSATGAKSAAPVVPGAPPVASAPTPLPGPAARAKVVYDCTGFPSPPPACTDKKEGRAFDALVEKSRWYGVAGVPCASGVTVQSEDLPALEAAVREASAGDPKLLSPVARVTAQNAALRLSTCLRPATAAQDLRSHTSVVRGKLRTLVKRLALTDAELAPLDEDRSATLEGFLGKVAEWKQTGGGARRSPGIHEKSAGLSLSTHALHVGDKSAFYGTYVAMSDGERPHVTRVPGYVVVRQIRDGATHVCFGEPSPADFGCATQGIMRPVNLPEGALEVGAIPCDRCHVNGRSILPDAAPTADESRRFEAGVSAALLAEWTRAAPR